MALKLFNKHIDMAQFNIVSTCPSANRQDISQNATFLNGCAETSIAELSHKNDILKKQNNELLKKYAAKQEEQSKTGEQLAQTLIESYKYRQEIDKLTSTCEQLQKEKVDLEIQVKHDEAQLFQYKHLTFDSKKDADKISELEKLISIREKLVTKAQKDICSCKDTLLEQTRENRKLKFANKHMKNWFIKFSSKLEKANLLTAAERSNLEKLKKGIPIVTEDEEERNPPSSTQNMENENIIPEQDYSLITPLKDQGYEESGSKEDNIKFNQKHEKSEYKKNDIQFNQKNDKCENKKDVIHLNQNKTTIIPKCIIKDSHVSIDHSSDKVISTLRLMHQQLKNASCLISPIPKTPPPTIKDYNLLPNTPRECLMTDTPEVLALPAKKNLFKIPDCHRLLTNNPLSCSSRRQAFSHQQSEGFEVSRETAHNQFISNEPIRRIKEEKKTLDSYSVNENSTGINSSQKMCNISAKRFNDGVIKFDFNLNKNVEIKLDSNGYNVSCLLLPSEQNVPITHGKESTHTQTDELPNKDENIVYQKQKPISKFSFVPVQPSNASTPSSFVSNNMNSRSYCYTEKESPLDMESSFGYNHIPLDVSARNSQSCVDDLSSESGVEDYTVSSSCENSSPCKKRFKTFAPTSFKVEDYSLSNVKNSIFNPPKIKRSKVRSSKTHSKHKSKMHSFSSFSEVIEEAGSFVEWEENLNCEESRANEANSTPVKKGCSEVNDESANTVPMPSYCKTLPNYTVAVNEKSVINEDDIKAKNKKSDEIFPETLVDEESNYNSLKSGLFKGDKNREDIHSPRKDHKELISFVSEEPYKTNYRPDIALDIQSSYKKSPRQLNKNTDLNHSLEKVSDSTCSELDESELSTGMNFTSVEKRRKKSLPVSIEQPDISSPLKNQIICNRVISSNNKTTVKNTISEVLVTESYKTDKPISDILVNDGKELFDSVGGHHVHQEQVRVSGIPTLMNSEKQNETLSGTYSFSAKNDEFLHFDTNLNEENKGYASSQDDFVTKHENSLNQLEMNKNRNQLFEDFEAFQQDTASSDSEAICKSKLSNKGNSSKCALINKSKGIRKITNESYFVPTRSKGRTIHSRFTVKNTKPSISIINIATSENFENRGGNVELNEKHEAIDSSLNRHDFIPSYITLPKQLEECKTLKEPNAVNSKNLNNNMSLANKLKEIDEYKLIKKSEDILTSVKNENKTNSITNAEFSINKSNLKRMDSQDKSVASNEHGENNPNFRFDNEKAPNYSENFTNSVQSIEELKIPQEIVTGGKKRISRVVSQQSKIAGVIEPTNIKQEKKIIANKNVSETIKVTKQSRKVTAKKSLRKMAAIKKQAIEWTAKRTKPEIENSTELLAPTISNVTNSLEEKNSEKMCKSDEHVLCINDNQKKVSMNLEKNFNNGIINNLRSSAKIVGGTISAIQEASEDGTCNNLVKDLFNKHKKNAEIKEKKNTTESTLKLKNKQNKNVLVQDSNKGDTSIITNLPVGQQINQKIETNDFRSIKEKSKTILNSNVDIFKTDCLPKEGNQLFSANTSVSPQQEIKLKSPTQNSTIEINLPINSSVKCDIFGSKIFQELVDFDNTHTAELPSEKFVSKSSILETSTSATLDEVCNIDCVNLNEHTMFENQNAVQVMNNVSIDCDKAHEELRNSSISAKTLKELKIDESTSLGSKKRVSRVAKKLKTAKAIKSTSTEHREQTVENKNASNSTKIAKQNRKKISKKAVALKKQAIKWSYKIKEPEMEQPMELVALATNNVAYISEEETFEKTVQEKKVILHINDSQKRVSKKNNKSFCDDIVDNFNSSVAIGNENACVVQEASEEETCNNLTEDLLNKHLTNTKIKERENVRDSTLKLKNKQNKNVLPKKGNVSPITSLPSNQEINTEAKEFLNTKEHNKINSNVDIFETGIYLPKERETSAVIKVNTSIQNSTVEANFPINSSAKIPQFGLFASREFKLDDVHSFSSLIAPTRLLAKPGFTEASTFPRRGKACTTAFNDGDNPNENHQFEMNENDAQQMKANDISLLDHKPFMDNLIFLSPIKDKLPCSVSETGQNTTSLKDNVELLDAKETLATPKHAFMELPVVNNASDMSPKFESISNDVFNKNKRHKKSKKLPSEIDENKTNFISNYSEPQNEENVNKDTARKSPLSDRDPGFINAFSSEIDSDFETNLVIAEEIEISSPNTISEINSNNSTAPKKSQKRIVSNTSDPIHLAFNNVDKLKIKDSHYELYRDNLFSVLTNPSIVPNIKNLICHLVEYFSESKRSPMMSFLKNSDPNVLLPASEKCIVEVLFLIHQKNIPHLDKLLCYTVDAFHKIVIGKPQYKISGLSSFCRVITAICRLLKNPEKPRRLCNDLIKYGYVDGPFLIASIVSVWKEAFKVSDRCTVEEKLFLNGLAVISKSKPKLSTSKEKRKLSDYQWKTCFGILQLFLNCEIRNDVMDIISYLKMLIDQKYKKDNYDKAYLVTGSLVMYSRIQGFTWSHKHLLEDFINPNLNLYSNKEPNELAFQFFAYLYADIFHPYDNCKDVYSSYMRHEREFVHFYAGAGLLKLCSLRKDDLTDELMELIENYSQDARLSYVTKYWTVRSISDLKLNSVADIIDLTMQSCVI
ncbi:hypothetical protein CDAR_462171 [Caerostris darwini]|uniref:Uncharacterized protein n=1 Tax=Caerostris darwini TaxID=1538125 RepID=A0AAV4RAG9_9ARAC|nr:hypothetical protein CDAR_462171 [Caerostris darwini]